MPKKPSLDKIRSHAVYQEDNQPDVLSNKRDLNRRELLQVLGVAGASILLPACKKKEDKVPETKEVNEIVLGNVRFYLKNPATISKDKKVELFATLKRAYGKLKGYLGNEAMTYPEPISVPIELKKIVDGRAPIGMTHLSVENGKYDNDGNVVLDKRQKAVLLSLNSIAEHNVAHEFVHLYAQGTAFWTEAFWEGHAHAIENTLYPPSKSDDSFYKLLENKGINKLLDYGLDYSQSDRTLGAGIKSPLLDRMVVTKWELAWRDFIKTEPDFFKKFYKEVAKQKNEGKTSFSKTDLIRIGEMASSKFGKWLSNTECLKSIGESSPRKVFSASIIKDRQLIFAMGFKTHPKKLSGGKYTPAFLEPIAIGRLQIKTSTGKYIIPNWDNFVALSKIPREFVNNPSIQIQIIK